METFRCDNCGNEFPLRQMKEVMYEDGTERRKERLCPNCLDARMESASEVRGIAGDEKAAAVHINDSDQNGSKRESLGTRRG